MQPNNGIAPGKVDLSEVLIFLIQQRKILIAIPIIVGILASLLMVPMVSSTAKAMQLQQQQSSGMAAMLGQLGGLSGAAGSLGIGSSKELNVGLLENRTVADKRESESRSAQRLSNSLSGEDAQILRGEAESRKALIAKLRLVKATGRMPLELGFNAGAINLPDIALEDGDRLVMPPRPAIITVLGAVYSSNSMLSKKDERATDYLAQAGGMTRNSDEKGTYILRVDGSVISKEQSGWLSGFGGQYLMPGETIVIPEQGEKTSWTKIFRDWTQILYQFGIGAAALNALK